MEIWNKIVDFLSDKIPNTPIPVWVAIVAGIVLIIIICIIISVSVSKSAKNKVANKDNSDQNNILNEQKSDTMDNKTSSINNVGTDNSRIDANEQIINIEREIQTTAPDNISHSNGKPNNDTKAAIMDTTITVENPKFIVEASSTAPIAKPIVDDGKTVYTKGVSGKVLPPSSIAKPLVNHTNDNTSRPSIPPPIKPQQSPKSNNDTIADTIGNTPIEQKSLNELSSTPKTVVTFDAKTEDNKSNKVVKSLNDNGDTTTFGKYVLAMNRSNIMRPYSFELRANNGQLLFESEPYKVKPRLNSITAFRNNTKAGSFIIDEDKQGSFRFKLYNTKGELVGVGESYKTRQACDNSIESTKRFADSATIIEDATDKK